MSKLIQVRKALGENPNITIVGAPERNSLPDRDGHWSHTIDFYVAPNGGIYNAEELQAFMMSLVPGLEPSCKDDFHEWDHELEFGKLYFDEDIGTEVIRREITLTDEEMFASDGFVDGKQVIEYTRKVQRRTWVRLFPNPQVAIATLMSGNVVYRISKSELAKSHGIVAQILKTLS